MIHGKYHAMDLFIDLFLNVGFGLQFSGPEKFAPPPAGT